MLPFQTNVRISYCAKPISSVIMLRGKSPRIFTLLLLVSTLVAAPLVLSSPSWHAVKDASASTSGPGGPGTITVTSMDMYNGSSLSGFTIDVRQDGNPVASGYTPVTFTGLQLGVQYQVVMYWFGNDFFREFSSGDLNRYSLVTLNSTTESVSLTGLYQYVPPSQANTLNILAQFPNGTQIGTTFNNTDYIQHTPGMWLTVTPSGASQAFTGSYTGGSMLPFTLTADQSYIVSMTAGYGNVQFLHWADDGSTSLSRQVTLNGTAASYTAIYFVNNSATTTTSTASSTTTSLTSSSTSTTTATSSSTTSSTTTSSTNTTASSSFTSTSTASSVVVTVIATNSSATFTTMSVTTASTYAAPEFPVGPAPAFVAVLMAILIVLALRKEVRSLRVGAEGGLPANSRASPVSE
jgi:hypothetical protein